MKPETAHCKDCLLHFSSFTTVFLKPWRQEWLRRWPGHCVQTSLLSLFPSKVRERLFCQTPWPLWALLLRAWIKPFEKEIFYINGQPSNKLLQSSLPNHLVSHGELASTSALSLILFPPSSSSLEADTRGRWADEQSARRAGPSNEKMRTESFSSVENLTFQRVRSAP